MKLLDKDLMCPNGFNVESPVYLCLCVSWLCWNESTSLHGKAGYPYTEAARLSTLLWHSVTQARVALTIITSEASGDSDQELDKFTADLTRLGASVVLLNVTHPGCVLSSQVILLS